MSGANMETGRKPDNDAARLRAIEAEIEAEARACSLNTPSWAWSHPRKTMHPSEIIAAIAAHAGRLLDRAKQAETEAAALRTAMSKIRAVLGEVGVLTVTEAQRTVAAIVDAALAVPSARAGVQARPEPRRLPRHRGRVRGARRPAGVPPRVRPGGPARLPKHGRPEGAGVSGPRRTVWWKGSGRCGPWCAACYPRPRLRVRPHRRKAAPTAPKAVAPAGAPRKEPT